MLSSLIEVRLTRVGSAIPTDTGGAERGSRRRADPLSGDRNPGPGEKISRTVTSVESCH